MPRPSVSSSLNQGSDEINISPLIDMVFILLIFFIVTTVFVEETGVEVDKPQASAAMALEKQSILIAITNDNKVVYGGQEVGVNGVRSIVRRLTRDDDSPVIIQADKAVAVEMLVRVIDEAKLGGARKVSISTDN
ncbi:MAG: biopolymer transporter ExbD [Verrucomicrobia bacterium]|nr:biopolymer transporter ExbD [Verrucomicrobiota bacterium]